MSKDDFLGRWSKRKLDGEQENPDTAAVEVKDARDPTLLDEEQAALLEEGKGDVVALESDEDVEGEDQEPHPAEGIDIEKLEYDSDFTVFMDTKVPKALKRMALRKLWRSNPILANIDGLNDYDEDFTDAAAVFIDSAGKVISGAREQFWDDDQIAEGKDRIGKEADEDEVDENEAGEEEGEQETAEADGSDDADIDDAGIDDGDVENIDDYDELELAQSNDDAELEQTDKKDAEKTEYDGKNTEV